MSFVSSSTGSFFDRSISQMGSLRSAIERLQTQIATGERIERGSQDPAAAAVLRTLVRQERLNAVDADNAAKLAQDLTSATVEVEGVMSLLLRARELAVQAASDATGASGREAIASELEQMGEELFARANGMTLMGEPLFAGTAAGPAFTRDAGGVISYAGNTDNGVVSVAPATEIERGLTGTQVFAFDHAGAPTTTFAVLSGLTNALRGGAADPAAAAADALSAIDTALETATRSQTVLGTRLAWVDVIRQDQADRAIEVAEYRAEVGGTEIGDAIARLQQSLTALEATQAAFTRVSSLTLFNAL